jgi:tetratricopeptide (TPR) repeat protein
MRKFMKKAVWGLVIGLGSHGIFAQDINQGLYALDVEQYGNAGRIFRTLAQQSASAQNLYYLGNFYLESEPAKLDSAKMAFEKGVAADPKFPLNYVGLGSTLIAQGDKAGAKNQFNQALAQKKADKNAEVWYRIGEAYVTHQNNDPVEAVAALQKSVERDPKKMEAFLLLGDAFKMRNEGTNAANNYDKAIALNPKSAKGHLRLGQLWINARNYNEALKKFNEAVQTDPNYAPAYRQRGDLYYLAKDYPKAIADYEKYMSMSDNSDDAKLRYAGFMILTEQYPKSLEILNSIGERQQNNPIYYRLLGYAQYEAQDYQNGLQNIDKFFSMTKPESNTMLASDYEYLGKLQIASGQDTVQGMQNVYKAAEMDTSKVGIYADLGQLFFKGKKWQQAAEAYEKALTRGTKESNARDMLYLGLSYLYGKNYDQADTTFGRFIQEYPEQYVGNYYKGLALAAKDTEAQGLAKPYFERFIEAVNGQDQETKIKNKNNLVKAYDYLAVYYLKTQKDLTRAKQYANQILELDPNNARAKQFLQYKQSDLGMK